MNRYDELKKFYKNKRVLITGITGFKGTWLAYMLKDLGAKIYGIGLPPEHGSLADRCDINKDFYVTYGDITAPSNDSNYMLLALVADPDVVFHLAAQPLVSEGYNDPFRTFNTNIMGTVITHEILRTISETSDKKISLINVTTDKVYKEGDTPRVEGDELRGFDPYSLSKSCSDMITGCYRDSFDSKLISSTMRAGNVIGGGDYSLNRIIPDCVKAAQTADYCELRHPNSVRPYQHVFDVLTAYLTVAMLQYEDPSIQGEWNVGPTETGAVKTIDLANEMKKYLDFEIKCTGESIGHENPNLELDSNLILKSTDWSPVYKNLESMVNATAIWYKETMDNRIRERDAIIKQITEGFKYYEEN